MDTAKPVYTVGTTLRLPITSRKWDVLKIDQRNSGVYYGFDLLAAPFTAIKWYAETDLLALNRRPATVTVLPPPEWSNVLYHPTMTATTAETELTLITNPRVFRRQVQSVQSLADLVTTFGIVDKAAEQAAKAAAAAYALALRTNDYGLRGTLERVARLLEHAAYSNTRQAVYDAWKEAMGELGGLQLEANKRIAA